MKNNDVIAYLDEYDANKGYLRAIIKEEPHIRELRGFLEQVKGDERVLSSDELLQLSKIILGKKNREGDSQSSKIFNALAKHFGGYEALEALEANKTLTEEYVTFLEKNSSFAQELSVLLVSLTKKMNSNNIKIVCAASDKMASTDKIIDFFTLIDKRAKDEKMNYYLEVLNLLNQSGFCTDDILPLLFKVDPENIYSISRLLQTLTKNNELVTLTNVTRIFSLPFPYDFNDFLSILPITKDTLNILFEFENDLRANVWAKNIINNFNESNWDILPYLRQILAETTHGCSIAVAIQRLREISLDSQFVLTTILERAKISCELAESVVILSKANQLEKLAAVFKVATHHQSVARAVVRLAQEKLYNIDTIEGISFCPEYSEQIARLLIQLHKSRRTDFNIYQRISEHPESSSIMQMSFEVLKKSKLLSIENTHEISKITQDELLNLLYALEDANLLNQANLSAIFEKKAYVNTLASATRCLANGEVLTQVNFDLLINTPLHAHFIAEKVGGELHPLTLTEFQDNGATSFMQIRHAVLELAKGKGIFSAVENESSFKNRFAKSRMVDNEFKKLAEAHKEVLERETVYAIAKEVYTSFARWS